jgi:hypothetical protein
MSWHARKTASVKMGLHLAVQKRISLVKQTRLFHSPKRHSIHESGTLAGHSYGRRQYTQS